LHPNMEYYPEARTIFIQQKEIAKSKSRILVVTGGTSDIPVAEEAVVTAEKLGCTVERLYDVGVAGIHRLLANLHRLDSAQVIIAVAGMEGALPSVLGGLTDKPVIAVPTSIGYGANFGGLAALLAMLNSCASGVSVVNIDNGFGAGFMASTIIRQIELNSK
jgi:pyridinium-3,5-biscarboxylic acid mononucleotide synthase